MNNSENIEKKLYRFQPCNHTIGKELRAKKIKLDKIWFSSPKNLNDPMDIDRYFDNWIGQKDFESINILSKMAGILFDNNNPDPRLINENLMSDIKCWLKSPEDYSSLCNSFKQRLLQLGIACFAKDWNNPPLWAHYTGNWMGFVIEYSVDELKLACANNDFLHYDVNYKAYLESATLRQILLNPSESLGNILNSKILPWSYENEWRLISMEKSDCDVDIPTGLKMTGIILGPRSPQEQKDIFLKKCKNWEIDLKQINIGLDGTLHLKKCEI